MFNPASCAFCDKLFTIPMGGVISPYGPVCNECKQRSLTETNETHEIEADRPDLEGEYSFDEEFQDMNKSTAFERAWMVVKYDDDKPNWGQSDDLDIYQDEDGVYDISRPAVAHAEAHGIGEDTCPECGELGMVIQEGSDMDYQISFACSNCGLMDGEYGERQR